MFQIFIQDTKPIDVDIFMTYIMDKYSYDKRWEEYSTTNVYGVKIYVVSFITLQDPIDVIMELQGYGYDLKCEQLYSIKDKKRV